MIGLSTTGLADSITSTATVATNTAGWTTWSTATLKSSDNSYANTGTNTSATGTLSGFLFSAVPATAAIEGFVVSIEASEANAAVNGYLLTAISSNSGTNYSAYRRSPDSGEFPTSDTAYTEGSSTDTWGISWTIAGATSTLRVKIVGYDASATGGYVTQVDSVTVTVYYDTAAPSGVTNFSSVQSSTATGQINLSWTAPGDDGSSGNLTGNYRIQYATYTATWSTSSTPTNATTVTITTTSAVPASAQFKAITGLVTQTTYYFVMWSQDNAGLWSGISNTTSTLMDLTSPSTSTIAATAGLGQVTLSWNSAGDNGSTGNLTGNYRIQYATYTATWSTTTTPTNATTVTISTTNMVPGSAQTNTISSLAGGTTQYFVLWSQDEGGNWSSISNTTSALPTAYFDQNQIEVSGLDGGLGTFDYTSNVNWADFNNDGNLDILAMGLDFNNSYKIRLSINNGNGTINPTINELVIDSYGQANGEVSCADFDNDGDMDFLILGDNNSLQNQLRIYKNIGALSFTLIEVDGVNGGLVDGGTRWGDFDNDGDLDILAIGSNSTDGQLRVYINNGNGTINPTQIEVEALNGGLDLGASTAWGDYDKDGDLDILASGASAASSYEFRIYKNNGNGTFNPTQIEVDGVNGGFLMGNVVWGDYDNDGDLDILSNGVQYSGNLVLQIYNNNGNGTIDAAQITIDGANGGTSAGGLAWGDFNTDGDLDILVSGGDSSYMNQLRSYQNNGNGTFDPNQIEIDGANGGLYYGSVAWGDYDKDGDPDVLVSGNDGSMPQLRIYKNLCSTTNTAPTPPTTLTGGFTFNPTSVSVASFTWVAGTDTGTGATPENVITYDLQISTTSNFSKLMFPGELGATPRMGSYLKPPKIFNSNTYYGMMLKSTNPWTTQSTASYGLRTDTTYYYRVKTIDAGLSTSTWSSSGSLLTGAAPSTSTLAVTAGAGQATLTWRSAGDDYIYNNLTGNYRIQYATYTATWSTSATPTNATTVTISTTNIVPGSTQSKVVTGLLSSATSYFVLWTQDDVGTWSTISNTTYTYLVNTDFVAPSTSTLAATAGLEQVTLTWNSAGDDGATGALTGGYRIQYATYTATWSTSTTPTNATTVTIATTSTSAGSAQTKVITGLSGMTTYYFVLWTQDDGANWSTISNTTSSLPSAYFDPNQIEVDGDGGGLDSFHVAWGDFDNDSDLDILVNGLNGSGQLRVYKNNGNGTFDPAQIEVDGINNGLQEGGVAWGDFDNDGDLDIACSGYASGGIPQLRVYKNNGNGTIDATQIEVDGAGNGLYSGNVAWGDFDNDGDLDLTISGTNDDTNGELRVYENNGNGTIDPVQIDIDGANGGLYGNTAWGDFDNDGDLDILGCGWSVAGRQLRVYSNNGNGTIDFAQIEVDGLNNGLSGTVAWGDMDADNDLDILLSGYDGSAYQLRVYQNNGNGTFNATQEEVDGTGDGLGGEPSWGDFDNDGDLDILLSGTNGSTGQLRVYKGNGNGTFDNAQIEVDGLNNGLISGGSAWGDFDNDSDLDILAAGTNAGKQLRVYKNLCATPNTTPTKPATLTGGFTFSSTAVSIASFTWSAGSDSGTGATPENTLTYDLQISTTSDFSQLLFPGQMGATPRMGSYLKPPKIFNTNTYYGALLKSTNPWTAQTTAKYGLRADTTYYYRVKTVDAGLAESAWSDTGTLLAAAPPSTSTLAATAGSGEVTLTWNSAGNDGSYNNLTGNYRIQYATYTASWNTASTPTNATTVTIATTSITPGDAQTKIITGLFRNITYYFVLWSQDDLGTWSGVSNTTSAVPSGESVSPSTSTLTATAGAEKITLGWASAGDDGSTGDLTGIYRIQYATYTATWSTATTPTNATTLNISTSAITPGSAQTWPVSSLTSGTTYYFVLWSQDDVGNWSSISNTTSAVPTAFLWFDPTQIEVDGASGGVGNGGVAWGDFDTDGDLDILIVGDNQLRVYKNNANGTFDPAQIEVDGSGNGTTNGSVAWGDFDNDGDLDILLNGEYGGGKRLRVYLNNGNGTFDPVQIEVDGLSGGLTNGSVAWGDSDNDGDLDILTCGLSSTGDKELRIYRNNGNGSIDANQIEVDGAGGGLYTGQAIWGDFDNDGDLDIIATGYNISSSERMPVYKNNGNGTFDPTEIAPIGSAGYWYGRLAWGDYDNDGDLDIIATGRSTPVIHVINNNGNGTFNSTPTQVDVTDGGLRAGGVAWGDFDTDGDLDVLASGTYSQPQLRVYKNNGNATFNATQIEVDGLNNGLASGGVAWGDYDNDQDIDILVSGIYSRLRVYTNLSTTANTAPTAPTGVAGSWDYNASGLSTATFKWSPAVDSGTGATPDNVLTYQVQVSTRSDFTGDTVVAGQWATPGMGNYFKPPKIFDGNSKHGAMLHTLSQTNTTYYFKVKAVDAGLRESAWSDTASLYSLVASSVPSAVADLSTAAVRGDGQIRLTWTAPLNITAAGNAAFDLRYSTVSAITNDTQFNNATAVTGEPTPDGPGLPYSMALTNLTPGVTYYFAMKSSNDNGTGPLDVNSVEPSALPNDFDATQIDMGGGSAGLSSGDVAWGDFDNDGDLDVLASGQDSSNLSQVRTYINNGNGTMSPTPIEIDGLNGGIYGGVLAWGDYDNDGDLDILASGADVANAKQLRVYLNNANGTFDPNQIEVDGLNGGLYSASGGWGDFDNDGDLDILVNGLDSSSAKQFRVYKNNGNGTFDGAQIDVDGSGGGLYSGSPAWGDFDNDGDLDILVNGLDTSSGKQLRVYKNNGNATFDTTQIEVESLNGGLSGGTCAWGDFDADGDLDILGNGINSTAAQLRVYTNNGNGTFSATEIDIEATGDGLSSGDVAWGDVDNDGDLDILASGQLSTTGTYRQLRVYKNNGNATFNPTQQEIEGLNIGLSGSAVAWGDFDIDGDLDILTNGTDGATKFLSIYKNMNQYVRANTAPSAPATLSSTWAYSATGISTATFKWVPAADNGVNPTPANGITYQVEISTLNTFTGRSIVPNGWASPGMGNYLKPPKIFDGNTTHGVMLHYLPLTNTTYYFRVKAIDAGLKESAWSSTGNLFTTVASSVPAAVTNFSTGTIFGEGQVTLSWTAPLNINSAPNPVYDIRYSTTAAITNDSQFNTGTALSGEPTPGVPGASQNFVIASLTPMLTYYFGLKSSNDIGTSALDTISTRPYVVASFFDATQIEVDGVNNGLRSGDVAWGDYDSDGDLDILVSGYDSLSIAQLRIYKNNGAGGFDTAQIEIDGLNNGLYGNGVAWGDFDIDGDLDILVSGKDVLTLRQLRVYKNNGNGTIDPSQIEIEGTGNGIDNGKVAWGDYNNDGALDILANGTNNGSSGQLRVYNNNRNGTFDSTQIEVDSLNGGLYSGGVVWGDYDKDGDLDIMAGGLSGSGQLRVYANNGNGSFNDTQIEVDGAAGGLYNGTNQWGDFDNDGDLDILINGYNGNPQLRVYLNNGNGTFDVSQIEVDGLNNGLYNGSVAWGDHDNDGDIDILVSGYNANNRQLRVYGNNGNGTFSPTQIEVEGLGGGLEYSSDAWGDFDNDGDLDVLANGTDGSQYQLRVYKNLCVTANTSPSAPGTLSSSWAYDASGSSTATFKWTPALDNGTGATPDNGLSYQIEISTSSGFTGTSTVPGQWATPGMGNYLKPPKIFDGNTTHGVLLHSLAATNTTYYFRVKTIDSGLKESAWSATESLYTLVASSAPFAVTNLVATSLADGAQVRLRWTAPFNIQSGSGPSYDIRYSAIGAISNDTDFDNATPLTGEPAPGFPGATEIALIDNLLPLTTYYFAIKSSHSNGTSPLDSSSPRPNAYAYVFLTSLSIDGSLDGAMSFSGGTGWGDFDNDGDLDILAMGHDGYYLNHLRVYKNNGNGTIDYSEIEVPGASASLDDDVAWGDFDNDGDLDILANGASSGTTAQLRVYKNNGNGTFDIAPIEIDGAGGGLYLGNVEWGDFDNDGDLDVLVCGNATGGATKELRIYKNNGNATFDANQIDVDGAGGGLNYASASWGDFDMEGDLDILIAGNDGTNRQLRIYKNNGNGTMDGTQIEVDGANNGLDDGAVAWGDTDNDGDLDILASGNNGSGQLRVYKNNGNATFDAVQIEVDGLNGGPNEGDCAWGDFDLDGDIDIALIGQRRIWVYKSNGNGTFDGNEIQVNALADGLVQGGIAWGDYDSDGDPDLLVSGVDGNEEYKYLRIYKNNYSGNTSPTAPATASPGFTFSSTAVSIASFTWSAGSDSGTGATPENVLTYDVQISTTSDFSTLLFPGQLGASPRMGSYLKPPKIFNSNADYGIVLKSTDPWNTQSTANFGLRTDTTYYYRVKTIDAGLAESAWSAAGTLLSGAPPSTSTLNATTTLNEGEALLAWTSAGDDGMIGDLTGNYRIQYATYTAAWSAESTPTDATTVTISTSNVVPGSDQTYLATSLPTGNTYYFVLWSQDDVNAWSTVSNTASAWLAGGSDPISPSTSTLAAASTATDDEVLLTWNSAGDDDMDGNLTGTYRLQYATYTATWSTESTPTDATTITISTTNAVPGSAISYKATGLTGGLTYYFVLWSGDEIPNWSDISNTTSAMSAYRFDPNPINVDGPGGGLYTGSVAWGDFDNDGYLDALASGYTGSTVELRIYKNNGNGTMDATQINVDGAGGGVFYSGATWGDYDNDGDLDVLASGKQNSGSTLELRIYKNNGNGTINQAQIEVDGAAGGLWQSNVSWGDYDNDGDMDIVVGGERSDNVTRELRLYKNNGNGTIDPIQIEIAGAGNGMGYGFGGLGWGDFDNDGDIDILASGYATGNSVELRIYRNNGNGSIDPVPIEVDGTGNGLRDGGVAWGDFDNDGDSDILVSGYGSSRQLRIYKNNGNGTMDATQIEVDGAGGGLRYGGVAWGDFDNDGDIDILANGNQTSGSTRELRVYSNNGNGTINPEQLEVAGTGLGLYYGGVGWGDFDDDNDLDILVSGEQTSGSSKELRIYKNRIMTSNIAPTAPATLTGGFSFNASAVSVASMTWNAGTDSGTGATPENVLTYDLQISTVSNFNSVIFPGQMGASPRMGSYLKPPKIFNSNTYYGVVLKSTDPWNAQATTSYGLRTDTTYYYRVKTVDSALEESSWSSGGSAYSGVSPSTSTLAAAAGTSQASLSWTSAGDDGMNGNLTGQYRIQYATYTATWSTSSTPANATTVTLATTTQSPGSAQGYMATGLTGGLTYYFVLWSGDEVPNWSTISNTTNTVPAAPVTVTLSEAVGQPGWIGQGETQRILGTAQAVLDLASGVTVSSVAVRETGSYTADGNLTNVEVWVSSSGHIDASAIRLENTAKAFSSDAAVFTQNVTVSTTPLYFIARADVSGSATEGTFDLSLQVYTTALTANNPIAFTNATDVVAPPSGAPSGLTATASGNLLRVSLSWGASAGADTYSVYRATYSGVTTTDFLLGITNATSFNDDYIPPQQQMYYTVLATNRAGASGAGSAANATSVDVPALTTSNIYLRAGVPGPFGNGNPAYRETASTPKGVFCDYEGNVYIADTVNNLIRFIAKKSGTYFGQAMTANSLYTIVGGGGALGDGGLSTSAQVNRPTGGAVDINGNLYVADTDNCRVRFVPKVSGTYFGQAMTANFIYTIAGNGTASFSGDGGVGTSAQLSSPTGLAVDVYGNVYIADYGNHRIRFIARTTGTYFGQAMTARFIYTIAGDGTGTYGGDGGASTVAQIKNPFGVSVDAAGNVYISDYGNYRIRFVPKTGGTYFAQTMNANSIYTIAGSGTYGYDGDGAAATAKRIAIPYGITVDAGGNLYIADRYNFRVRFVPKIGGTYFGQVMTANSIYTIAGTGTAGYDGDGAVATSKRLNNPYGVGVDNQGNLYVADTTNNRVRFVPRAGGTYFGQAMTASSVYTLVGGGAGGYDRDDSISTSALMDYPAGVTIDADGNIYFSDKNNNRIRFVPKTSGSHFGQSMTANNVYTIAGNGTGGYLADNVAATTTRINAPNGVSVDEDKNVYIADSSNRRIRFIPRMGGTYFGQTMLANYIYTIAGDGTSGYNSDAIAATAAQISDATGVSVDKSGNVYIADYGNHRLRFVPKTGGSYFGQTMTANNIYTIAGNGTGAYGGDGGLATSAQIRNPYGSAVDAEGNVYVADTTNQRIRLIAKTSGTYFGQAMTANFIYTIAGNGTGAFGGDGGAATSAQIWNPTNVSVDGGGNIYIAGNSSPRIRFVPKKNGTYFGQSRTANYIYTIGGNGGTTYDGENGSAAGKNISKPEGVYIGPDHMLYLTDYNNKIRMIAGEDFIAPSTSTLAASAGLDEATISWASAGDDNVNLGNLTGNYRIQYATYTAVWSTSSTPTNATTVTLATTTQSPGSAQGYTATGLTGGLTYYFVLWSGDEVPNWSTISNTTSTIPVIPLRSVTITSGNSQAFGVVMMGSQVVGTTGTVVTNDGNLVNTYALRASTQTVGSPWQILSSTPAGPNQMVFYGVFDGASAPGLGSFDVDDVIGPVNRDSTSAQFSVAGSTTGASVPAGQDRTLWIRLDAPTTTTTVADQTMRIEITAQPP